MVRFFGIILVDGTQVSIRIYSSTNKQWKLLHYKNRDLLDKKSEKPVTSYAIAETIADFFATTYTQKIIDWKIAARALSKETVAEITLATGLRIEHLSPFREQELLSKGLFTEFW